jgi:PAS domain S-box-containing protein
VDDPRDGRVIRVIGGAERGPSDASSATAFAGAAVGNRTQPRSQALVAHPITELKMTAVRQAGPRPGLNAYTNVVMLVGATLVALFARDALAVNASWLTALFVLAIATAFFKLNLPIAGGGSTMTLGYVVGFIGLVVLGAHPTALAVSAGIWTQCTYRPERKTPMDYRRRLFSVACGIITVEAAGWVFEALGGVPGSRASSSLAAPLAGAALAYFFVNTWLVAGAIALSSGEPIGRVWHANFMWSGPSYFISAGVVGLGAVTVERGGYVLALLLTTPLLLTYTAYRSYVTRLTREQDQLRLARDYTQSIIHSMKELLIVIDPSGQIATVNAATRELLGYESHELLRQRWRAILAGPDGADRGLGDVTAQPMHNRELSLRTKRGDLIPVLFSSSPLAGDHHQTQGTVCVALDIRDRKQAEQARRRRVERLQRQQEALADLARDRAFHLGNFEEAARLVTATAGSLTSADSADVWLFNGPAVLSNVDSYDLRANLHSQREEVRLEDAPEFAAALRTERVISVTEASLENGRWRLAGPHAEDTARSVLHAPIRLGAETVGVVTLSRTRSNAEWAIEEQQFAGSLADLSSLAVDARNRRHAREELETAKEAAEAANRAMSAFVANMSHELRTPLNAIIGYVGLLKEESADAGMTAQLADLTRIEHASLHLLSLVNDVLDFSKIEAGKVTLDREDVDAAALVRDVAATAQLAADKNTNTLTLAIDPGLGIIHTDAKRVRQVLINLLSNACKFTSDGEITLRAIRADQAGSEWLVLEVEDTGIGMSPEEMDKIFREFAQADVSTTRRFGGTGLGLAISQRLCHLLGGTIDVRSEKGVGSVFTVRLPATPPMTDAPGCETAGTPVDRTEPLVGVGSPPKLR